MLIPGDFTPDWHKLLKMNQMKRFPLAFLAVTSGNNLCRVSKEQITKTKRVSEGQAKRAVQRLVGENHRPLETQCGLWGEEDKVLEMTFRV